MNKRYPVNLGRGSVVLHFDPYLNILSNSNPTPTPNTQLKCFSWSALSLEKFPQSNFEFFVVIGIFSQQYLNFDFLLKSHKMSRKIIIFNSFQFKNEEPADDGELLNLLKYVRPGDGFIPTRYLDFSQKVDINGDTEVPLYAWLKVRIIVNPFLLPAKGWEVYKRGFLLVC